MKKIQKLGHWIDGLEISGKSTEILPVVDPGSGQMIATVARGEQADVDLAIGAATKAFSSGKWPGLAPHQRSRLMLEWARLIGRERANLATLLSKENGKPLSQADGEVETTIRNLEYFSGWADKVHGRVVPLQENVFDYIRQEPLGVVGHITPWNYPLDIFARGVAPCLAVGNTVVVKPAEETPLSSIELARLASEAGIPAGVVNVVTGLGAEAGAALASHSGLQALSFCGSIEAGKQVLVAAAQNITPVVSLELGGKSPCIIFDDSDVTRAAESIAGGVCFNAGQSCGFLSRILVQKEIFSTIVETILNVLANVHLGYGLDDPDMGPLVSETQLERVLGYIQQGRREGAVLSLGGNRASGKMLDNGFFIEPTVFTNVEPGMQIVEEEIFGPVIAIMSFGSEEEAIEIANASKYGLSAEIWSRDLSLTHRVAAKLDVSHVTVNGGGGFGIEAPFGGVKQSGFGREGGWESILQYSRVKNVWINL